MATIKPFRAWHYNPEKVAIDRVIAPPYDVISKKEERSLHDRDPHNVIRLILGQAAADEARDQTRYEQAKNYLESWVKEKTLEADSHEHFYLHEMRYRHPFSGRELVRLGFFGLLKLEPFERKVVFAHERTHSSPKADRGRLLRATQANLSPIFTLYEDPTSAVDAIRTSCKDRKPIFDFVDDRSMAHKVWALREPEALNTLVSILDRKRVFIADGHHRYETALQYAEEMRSAGPPAGGLASDYVLSTFVRFHDPGLLILPIHRVVSKVNGTSKDTFLGMLKSHFVLHSVSRAVLDKVSGGDISEGFGLAFPGGEYYLLELKDWTRARHELPNGKPEEWYQLDANLISHLILGPLLKIGERVLERQVEYTPFVDEVFEQLAVSGTFCVFLTRPITAERIKQVCEAGELMPQKSTYFYPKLPSGLLFYRH